jgi:hypothetical protein
MYSEKRKDKRAIITRQPKDRMQIVLGDQWYPVLAVEDASPTGIRLKTATKLNVGANILVRYFDEKIDLKVNGVVVWNSISSEGDKQGAEPNAFIIGIELASPSLLKVFW